MSDHYTFVLVHVGTNYTAKKNSDQIRGDYKTFARRIKELGVHVAFSSVPTVESKGPDSITVPWKKRCG